MSTRIPAGNLYLSQARASLNAPDCNDNLRQIGLPLTTMRLETKLKIMSLLASSPEVALPIIEQPGQKCDTGTPVAEPGLVGQAPAIARRKDH